MQHLQGHANANLCAKRVKHILLHISFISTIYISVWWWKWLSGAEGAYYNLKASLITSPNGKVFKKRMRWMHSKSYPSPLNSALHIPLLPWAPQSPELRTQPLSSEGVIRASPSSSSLEGTSNRFQSDWPYSDKSNQHQSDLENLDKLNWHHPRMVAASPGILNRLLSGRPDWDEINPPQSK